jgi:F0F1-type ATP synthase epsilon subunit
MAQAAKTFQCTVIAPQGRLLDCRAASVIIPAHDGLRGILPGHMPIFCQLGLGPMIVTCPPAAEDRPSIELLLFIDGGFLMFNSNNLAVTASEGVSIRDMTNEKIEQFIEICKAAIASAPPATEQSEREMLRLKVFESLRDRSAS